MSACATSNKPSDWSEGPLSQVIRSLDAGVSVNAEDRPHRAGEVGVLKTSAISAGTFDPRQNKAVIPKERRLVSEPVMADSILVSRMNTPELVGETCYVNSDWPTLFLPDRIWQLKPKDRDAVSMRWLSNVLRTSVYRRYVERHASGTSGSMKNIPKARMLEMTVAYPPIAQQRLIATILDTIDVTIRQSEAIIDKLKQVKHGLVHDLLTRGIEENGELRPPQAEALSLYKQSPLGWIPKAWIATELGRLVDQKRPIAYGILMPGYGTDRGVRVVKVKDIIEGEIDMSDLLLTSPEIDAKYQRSRLKAGDLLFTIRGTVGRTAFVPTQLDMANITQDTARLALVSSHPGFVREYLGTPAAQRFIETHTVGVAVRGINLRDVRRIPIALPPAEEASALSQTLEQSDIRQKSEVSRLNKLQALKFGLMDDILTGHVRVTSLLTD